ncbi:MAG: HEAT repeat domain-containing protein [Myxococcales bacterium]|nr:HEAT repeat domain-containing protein [Myxococcales bacterium]
MPGPPKPPSSGFVRGFALALVLTSGGAVGACEGPREVGPQVVRIEGIHHRGDDGVMREEARLVPQVGGALKGLGGLRLAGREHRGEALGAELWYQEQTADDGAREIYLQAQIEVPAGLRPVLGGVIHTTVILEREGDAEASLDDDVAAAAARAFAVLDTRLALARGDHDAVRELLRDDDPELVILALEWIREHTPAEFSGDLLALLEHDDARVATLAVECLGYAADPTLALAIIRHARPMSREHTREVYRALARLRGAESLGYLRFAAANEDDSILREEAERSLRLALTGIPAEPPVSQRGAERLARGHRQ